MSLTLQSQLHTSAFVFRLQRLRMQLHDCIFIMQLSEIIFHFSLANMPDLHTVLQFQKSQITV